jgi:hypothetical protein
MFLPGMKMHVTTLHPDAGSLRLGFFDAPLNIAWKAI